MISIWNDGIERQSFKTLTGDTRTDVLVIGGGIAGILCAYMLKRAGVDCLLAEADRICSGVTENTTAKITCQHGLIYDKMIKRYGLDTARLYYTAQNEALSKYKRLCADIDCDFKISDSYVYSKDNAKKLERELKALSIIGCKAEFESAPVLPFKTVGAVKMADQAEFSPLKFLFAIARELKILENTRVIEVTTNGVVTDNGKIRADKVIVATHFPFINKYGGYFVKMYQHRSYVLALKNAPLVNGMYVDEADDGLSFRNYKNLLLLGGGGHRTGKSGGSYNELRRFASEYYKDSREIASWATQDCKTLDDIPYIGRYSKMTPSLYVTTGFNKWGMTSAMVSALLLCDLVQGKKNELESVFSPSRSILHPQLFGNTVESFIGLVTPTAPRCPHLGCALKYNKQEHSWDCPCHGSRFDESGKLLDNPATDDKSFK